MLSALEAKRNMTVISRRITYATRQAFLPDLVNLVANYVTSEDQLFEELFFTRHSMAYEEYSKTTIAVETFQELQQDAAVFPVLFRYLEAIKSTLHVEQTAADYAKCLLRRFYVCNRLRCYYSPDHACTCGRPMIPLEISL